MSANEPGEAASYLKPENERLLDLKTRYATFSKEATAPLHWTDSHVKAEEIFRFRGDNAYLWQLRGTNMDAGAYALAAYYVQSIDHLGLLDRLEEDGLFGACTFEIGGRRVSRDLLDSIIEIYFLEKHLQLSTRNDFKVADIIARRVCRHLVRNGWLEGEHESAFLSERAGGDDGLDALRLSSITYRIATGTHRGQRRRPRRAALGPLSGIGEKWPQTVAW